MAFAISFQNTSRDPVKYESVTPTIEIGQYGQRQAFCNINP